MRIGIDYRAALHASDGIARYTRELVRALGALAVEDEILLFASTWREPAGERAALDAAVAPARLRRRRVPSRLAASWMHLSAGGADRWLGGVDVFHHTQAHVMPVRDACEVATLHDCIYVESPELVTPANSRRMTESARRATLRASAVIVPSEFTRAQVLRCFPVEPERIHVVPLGIDHLLRPTAAQPRARAERYVLTVARVELRKNHLAMLRAFELAVGAGFEGRWIVAGARGLGAETFERALADSPVRARVEVRGEVDESELGELYAGASAFLFLSRAEGFGIPPLEALASGVPTVVADAGSLPEVCGDAATCVAPDDFEGAARALVDVLTDRDLADARAERGRAHAERFTWRRAAEATLAVYRTALAAGRVAK
ncbi:MAG: glycosyltransferase family 4 protein [Planctomycetes bacterium]|nr:glycosyltransferase family 4 protein [Planctomycetota bacterium]